MAAYLKNGLFCRHHYKLAIVSPLTHGLYASSDYPMQPITTNQSQHYFTTVGLPPIRLDDKTLDAQRDFLSTEPL
jgi:hypothetical protein